MNFQLLINNIKLAGESRDALSKALYSSLFDFVVFKLNERLKSSEFKAGDCFISVLDIFGFEIFEKNSLEQLCINFANGIKIYIILYEIIKVIFREITATI